MVEYVDGSVKALLADPGMALPIQYALLWDRAPSPAPRFDWSADRLLHLGEIDVLRYPCFAIVLETARSGDLGAMVGLSAADELAVERFLHGDIAFTDIASLLRRGAELGARARGSPEPDLDGVIAIEAVVGAGHRARRGRRDELRPRDRRPDRGVYDRHRGARRRRAG